LKQNSASEQNINIEITSNHYNGHFQGLPAFARGHSRVSKKTFRECLLQAGCPIMTERARTTWISLSQL